MAILIGTGVFYALLDRGDVNHLDAVAVLRFMDSCEGS